MTAVGIHFGWNTALGFLCGLPVSGLRIFNVVVRTSTSGTKWMTGGSYGIEASAIGTIAVLVGPVSRLTREHLPPLTETAHENGLSDIQP